MRLGLRRYCGQHIKDVRCKVAYKGSFATVTVDGEQILRDAITKAKGGLTTSAFIKRVLADYLNVTLPPKEYVSGYDHQSPLLKFGSESKTRNTNIKNMAQYILDNWESIDEDTRSKLVQFTVDK